MNIYQKILSVYLSQGWSESDLEDDLIELEQKGFPRSEILEMYRRLYSQ